MAIQTIKATMQMRHGREEDFNPDKMTTGEWALSTDSKKVWMCFAPGIVLRMATYEAFEQDMIEIQTILAICRDIQVAVGQFMRLAEQHASQAEMWSIVSQSWAVGGTGTREGENTNNSKYYSELSKNEADRAKSEADRASAIAGFSIDTELSETSTNPVQNKTITKALKDINVDISDEVVKFNQAEERSNITSGEKLSISLGKMMKWFADFSATAFDGLATKWRTARNINGMSVDGSANRVNYGTCSTAAATVAKVVACTGYALVTGAEIAVKFTVTNTAANPTLNVNGTGAKPVYYRGAAITAGYLAANRTYAFRYNGTQYELVGDIDTNATYNNMSGATANANGKAGLVPAPGAGKQNAYLRGDGTWVTPTNNLLATEPGTPLDAVQGKNLKTDVDALNSKLKNLTIKKMESKSLSIAANSSVTVEYPFPIINGYSVINIIPTVWANGLEVNMYDWNGDIGVLLQVTNSLSYTAEVTLKINLIYVKSAN